MHSTNSYLYTLLERIRSYMDLPEVDAKYSNDYLIRHTIGPAQTDVLSRLAHTTGCPVLLTMDLTLTGEAQDVILPPNVLWVLRIETIDEDGNRLGEVIPRSFWNPYGSQNWRIEGSPGALVLHVDSAPSGLDTARIIYQTNGDVLCHYGTGTLRYDHADDGAGTLSVTSGASTITRSSGSFVDDGFEVNDIVDTASFSTAACNIKGMKVTDVTALVLTVDYEFTATDTTDAAATVSANKSVLDLAATPTLGVVDRRENAYVGSVLRILPASGPVEERQITAHYYDQPTSTWKVEVRTPFSLVAADSVLYEIAPAGSQSLYEAIAAWAALKIGTSFLSRERQESITLQYRAAIKTIGDNLTYVQSRVPSHYERKTSDSEFYQPKILTIGTYVQ